MSVTFVYRSHYEGPSEKHVATFNDETLLAWFRSHWSSLAEGDVDDNVTKLLGTDVYGFSSLGEAIGEHSIAAPETMEALASILNEHVYVEGEILVGPGRIEVITDDDELQLAYYFFDDSFEQANPGRAAFLQRADWALPLEADEDRSQTTTHSVTTALDGGGGDGCVWLACLAYYDSGNLDDLEGAYAIPGVRMPELASFLASTPATDAWPFELRLLASQLLATEPLESDEQRFVDQIATAPAERNHWAVYSDWLAERGRASAGAVILERALLAARRFPLGPITNTIDTSSRLLGSVAARSADATALLTEAGDGAEPDKCHHQVGEHLAQLSLFTADWGSGPLYHQWILFDDRWLATHRDLGEGILRFAAQWNVLSD